jgi:hypothetical protein
MLIFPMDLALALVDQHNLESYTYAENLGYLSPHNMSNGGNGSSYANSTTAGIGISTIVGGHAASAASVGGGVGAVGMGTSANGVSVVRIAVSKYEWETSVEDIIRIMFFTGMALGSCILILQEYYMQNGRFSVLSRLKDGTKRCAASKSTSASASKCRSVCFSYIQR